MGSADCIEKILDEEKISDCFSDDDLETLFEGNSILKDLKKDPFQENSNGGYLGALILNYLFRNHLWVPDRNNDSRFINAWGLADLLEIDLPELLEKQYRGRTLIVEKDLDEGGRDLYVAAEDIHHLIPERKKRSGRRATTTLTRIIGDAIEDSIESPGIRMVVADYLYQEAINNKFTRTILEDDQNTIIKGKIEFARYDVKNFFRRLKEDGIVKTLSLKKSADYHLEIDKAAFKMITELYGIEKKLYGNKLNTIRTNSNITFCFRDEMEDEGIKLVLKDDKEEFLKGALTGILKREKYFREIFNIRYDENDIEKVILMNFFKITGEYVPVNEELLDDINRLLDGRGYLRRRPSSEKKLIMGKSVGLADILIFKYLANPLNMDIVGVKLDYNDIILPEEEPSPKVGLPEGNTKPPALPKKKDLHPQLTRVVHEYFVGKMWGGLHPIDTRILSDYLIAEALKDQAVKKRVVDYKGLERDLDDVQKSEFVIEVDGLVGKRGFTELFRMQERGKRLTKYVEDEGENDADETLDDKLNDDKAKDGETPPKDAGPRFTRAECKEFLMSELNIPDQYADIYMDGSWFDLYDQNQVKDIVERVKEGGYVLWEQAKDMILGDVGKEKLEEIIEHNMHLDFLLDKGTIELIRRDQVHALIYAVNAGKKKAVEYGRGDESELLRLSSSGQRYSEKEEVLGDEDDVSTEIEKNVEDKKGYAFSRGIDAYLKGADNDRLKKIVKPHMTLKHNKVIRDLFLMYAETKEMPRKQDAGKVKNLNKIVQQFYQNNYKNLVREWEGRFSDIEVDASDFVIFEAVKGGIPRDVLERAESSDMIQIIELYDKYHLYEDILTGILRGVGNPKEEYPELIHDLEGRHPMLPPTKRPTDVKEMFNTTIPHRPRNV
ncbi:MAG: hypothetical protein V3V78_04965 [Candidatus Woesearchaeota archaeon]